MDQKIYNELQEIKGILAKMVTKDDLKSGFEKQAEDFGEIVSALFTSADEKKADRTDVEALDKRVTKIERKLAL
jgi:ABC-type enterochelin transport system substrate-binding protein